MGCPTSSVRNYYYSLCNNPTECSSRLFCDGSLKSCSVLTLTLYYKDGLGIFMDAIFNITVTAEDR